MTAPIAAVRPAQDRSLRPIPWRRMAWVTWRQHRLALGGAAVLLGALAVWLWLIGSSAHDAYNAAAHCHPASSAACGILVGNFLGHMSTGQNIAIVLQVVPALIGAFVGAPVLAREMETGTFRYAWTLGFGRWRWALAKLVLLGVAVTAAAGAFSLLFSWYYQPFFAQTFSGNVQIPLGVTVFDLRGVAFAAWTLAAFAIGALAGMLIRRVVPALAVTLAVYAGLAVAAGGYLRQHYMAPLVLKNGSVPGSAWIISQQWYTKGGQPVSGTMLAQALQQGAPQLAGDGKGGGIPESPFVNQWLFQHGYVLWTSYQPGSRFWPFQWIEGGWLLALSALLIAAAVWLVRRRAS